ncbi:putative helicase [Zancudomyces culisetae]|uniref:Putative helicase n=1 Tax=Zancudomyces culisetae TaxID=1213189 RepID=A0A1R1PY55_ZANCU|nr:putative helicase [Zancudomyces culisetae]|eukprot:OMH85869.1 putative helicase [Zancudomyces culisetae]
MVWLGKGSNGKSMLMKLVEKAFGEYFCKLPSNVLTSKKSISSAPTPELALLDGTRIAVVQEPDLNESINHGTVKELTGSTRK